MREGAALVADEIVEEAARPCGVARGEDLRRCRNLAPERTQKSGATFEPEERIFGRDLEALGDLRGFDGKKPRGVRPKLVLWIRRKGPPREHFERSEREPFGA